MQSRWVAGASNCWFPPRSEFFLVYCCPVNRLSGPLGAPPIDRWSRSPVPEVQGAGAGAKTDFLVVLKFVKLA